MTRFLLRGFVHTAGIVGFFLIMTSSGKADGRLELINEYLDLVTSRNYESASQLWYEPSYLRATKFGIEYEGIKVKIDCASPIIRDFDKMKQHLYRPVKKKTNLSKEGFSTMLYSELIEGNLVEHTYYVYFDGDYHWLIFPQDYFCDGWATLETEFFKIHYEPNGAQNLHQAALDEADNFVLRMVDSLKIKSDDVQLLREKKIDYYYCGSDQVVEQIAGYQIKGMFDLGSNDIISGFFPHYHELVHFLINFKLRKLPLATQPLLNEGIAVHLGGRWGKLPQAFNGLAYFLVEQGMVTLDSLLTMKGFKENEGADIAYPVAGLFSSFLINEAGMDGYLDIYRDLSGSITDVFRQKADDVKNIILTKSGYQDWTSLESSFKEFMKAKCLDEASFQPGGVKGEKSIISSDGLSISKQGDWIFVEFSSLADNVRGNLLFDLDPRMTDQVSLLFEEQYDESEKFDGFRFGLKFDQNEAGLYDYTTNHIIAKYIYSLTPSDNYFDSEKGIVRVRFKTSLTGGAIPKKNDWKLMTH